MLSMRLLTTPSTRSPQTCEPAAAAKVSSGKGASIQCKGMCERALHATRYVAVNQGLTKRLKLNAHCTGHSLEHGAPGAPALVNTEQVLCGLRQLVLQVALRFARLRMCIDKQLISAAGIACTAIQSAYKCRKPHMHMRQ